jgi:hypothetical protein
MTLTAVQNGCFCNHSFFEFFNKIGAPGHLGGLRSTFHPQRLHNPDNIPPPVKRVEKNRYILIFFGF